MIHCIKYLVVVLSTLVFFEAYSKTELTSAAKTGNSCTKALTSEHFERFIKDYTYTPSMDDLELLIDSGYNVNHPMSDDIILPGMLPIEYLIQHASGQNSIVKLKMLIKAGADVNQSPSNGLTPLEQVLAHTSGNNSRVKLKLLMQSGADVNQYFSNGMSPIEYILRYMAIDAATPQQLEMFLEAGADPNALAISKSYKDKTTLDIAVDLGSIRRNRENTQRNLAEAVILLKEYGAKHGS